jgi:hypothetical protein
MMDTETDKAKQIEAEQARIDRLEKRFLQNQRTTAEVIANKFYKEKEGK